MHKGGVLSLGSVQKNKLINARYIRKYAFGAATVYFHTIRQPGRAEIFLRLICLKLVAFYSIKPRVGRGL